MSATAKKLLGIAAGVAAAGALIGFYIGDYIVVGPGPVRPPATIGANRTVDLTMQTFASLGGNFDNPTWVSYMVRDAKGVWRHSTVFTVPANATVHVTVYQYDGASGLRNPFLARPQGVDGGVIQVDGKTVDAINPDLASHTFAIPALGLIVPLQAIPDGAKNQCDTAPCGLDKAHRTITFAFHTGKAGHYRWQCFVPCAAGFIDGFGGPMQALGYMDGFLDVV